MKYLVSIREEGFNNLQSLVIDLLIFMRLKLLNLVQTSTLLNHHGNLVSLVQLLSCCENVSNSIQNNPNCLIILGSKEVTKRFKNTLRETSSRAIN